jgi:hypothetical protein
LSLEEALSEILYPEKQGLPVLSPTCFLINGTAAELSSDLTGLLLRFTLVQIGNLNSVKSPGMFGGGNYKRYANMHVNQIICKKGK